MKVEMRGKLAREPYEEKVGKVEQLIRLVKELPRDQTEAADMDSIVGARRRAIISAIHRRSVLKFTYNGRVRTVEPQTYGLSTTGREVLRAYERAAAKAVKTSGMAKLFDLEKISELQETGLNFNEALPAHNPDDSAMVEIFATLPPKN
jgi:predicted DNA-binding transcriptional regulator YafY